MVQCELSRICNYSATCPQSKQTIVCPFFGRKKEVLQLMGQSKKISTEEKCYLMG
jgi:hypothetical protein